MNIPEILIRCACGKVYAVEDLVPAPWATQRLVVPACWIEEGHERKFEEYVRDASLRVLRDQAMAGAKLQIWADKQGISIPDPAMRVFPDRV